MKQIHSRTGAECSRGQRKRELCFSQDSSSKKIGIIYQLMKIKEKTDQKWAIKKNLLATKTYLTRLTVFPVFYVHTGFNEC